MKQIQLLPRRSEIINEDQKGESRPGYRATQAASQQESDEILHRKPHASANSKSRNSATNFKARFRTGRINGLLANEISLSNRSTVWSIRRQVRRRRGDES